MDYLNHKESESKVDYIKKIVYGKLVYKTVTDDYETLSEKIFGDGNCYNESEVRKRMYGMKYLLEVLDKEKESNIKQSEILDELDQKKAELQKEKYKIQSLRLDLMRRSRKEARRELLTEEFILELKNQKPLPYPEFKELQKQDVKKAYVLSFADVHFGKEFESVTNQYDVGVVYDRFNKLFNEILEIVEENKIEKLIVLALGDLLEGALLRISQLQSLKMGIVGQTVEFMRFLVSWLNALSEYVEIEYYQTQSSNHTQLRNFGSKSNEFADEDMERIIFAYVKDMLKDNKRIRIHEGKDKYLIFKIFHYNVVAYHGHNLKDPYSFLKNASDKYKLFFDYAFLAHRHHTAIKSVGEGKSNNCEVINIPSIMGCDEYADNLMTGSKSGAILIEFTEKQGKRKTYDIILN
jgi:hypothetical protein